MNFRSRTHRTVGREIPNLLSLAECIRIFDLWCGLMRLRGQSHKQVCMVKRFLICILFGLGLFLLSCENRRKAGEYDLESARKEADALYKANDCSNCIELLNHILEIDSIDGESYFKRGFCHYSKGYLDESISDYLTAARLGYRESECYYNLGLIQMVIPNDSLGIVYLTKALELNPHSNEIREALESLRKGVNSDTANIYKM